MGDYTDPIKEHDVDRGYLSIISKLEGATEGNGDAMLIGNA